MRFLLNKERYGAFFLALRYSRGRSPFLRFMNFLSTAGISIGVATLILTLSVMSGMREEIRDKILGITPHVLVMKSGEVIRDWEDEVEKIREIEGVEDVFPLMVANAIVRKGDVTASCVVQCIPTRFINEEKFKNFIRKGKIFSGNYVNVGKVLAKNLGLDIGDSITLISPYGETTMFGFVPNTTDVEVGGVVEVGIFDWDSVFVFVDMAICDQLFDTRNWASSIAVMLKNPDDAEKFAWIISANLDHSFFALPWTKTQKNLFAAMQLEKLGMTIILTLIIIVASFNILSTLAILVRDKARDIAVMKTFGVSVKEIRNSFLGVGLWICARGTAIGTFIGLILVFLLSKYKIIKLPEDVYFISYLPAKLEVWDIVLSWIIAFVPSFFASLFPVLKAMKKEPFEVLRREV